MVDRYTVFIMVLGLCVVNGIFTPYFKVAIPITVVLMPELFPRTLEWVLFWTSVMLSSATLLFSGIPAALYERLVENEPESTASMWIWLTGAGLLSLPALQRVL